MRIRKNESVAAARTMFVDVRSSDGVTWAPPETVPASMLYYDNGTGALVAAGGTWAPRTKPLVVADFVFTADAATDQLAKTAHTLKTGDGPLQFTTTTTLPGGTALATDYYVIKIDADHFKIATTRANALLGTAINITSAGTGTHTASDTAATLRCMPGMFVYTFTQAETNVTAPYISITVDDDETVVTRAEQTADVWVRAFDEDANVGGPVFGDLIRYSTAIIGGPVTDYTTTGYSFRDPWTLVVRANGTVATTGRSTVTPGTIT